MKASRVAITKSRLYRGGVLNVLIGLTRILNDSGLVPDLLTLKSHVNRQEIRDLYGRDLRMNIREIALNVKLPYEWHFLWFNLISRFYLRDYDLVINSSNTSFLTCCKARTLSYVHYPRRDRVRSKSRSIHFPEGPNKTMWEIGSDPFRLASLLYRWDRRSHANERVVANSEFTKRAILDNYDLRDDEVQVVHPPVEILEPSTVAKDDNMICSLARFSPEKRQLEQIQIAEDFGSCRFFIMGFVGDDRYFRRCEQYVQEQGLGHVTLIANGSYDEVQETLSRSRFFLHNMRNEPFGITTVQAIAKGCVPLVHDSGGQREVVPFKDLRFSSKEEAVTRLRELVAGGAQLEDLSRKLQAGNERFSSGRFSERMRPILMDMLGQS